MKIKYGVGEMRIRMCVRCRHVWCTNGIGYFITKICPTCIADLPTTHWQSEAA
jgi:hypothetical protein